MYLIKEHVIDMVKQNHTNAFKCLCIKISMDHFLHKQADNLSTRQMETISSIPYKLKFYKKMKKKLCFIACSQNK